MSRRWPAAPGARPRSARRVGVLPSRLRRSSNRLPECSGLRVEIVAFVARPLHPESHDLARGRIEARRNLSGERGPLRPCEGSTWLEVVGHVERAAGPRTVDMSNRVMLDRLE